MCRISTRERRWERWLWLVLAVFFAGAGEAFAIKQKPAREATDYPEAVLITARNSKMHKEGSCSGVLLASRVVLTAAHCLEGFDSWTVTAPYAKGGAATTSSRTAKIHPDHQPGTYEHDLGLLILDEPIVLESKFPTLPDGDLYPLDTQLIAIGRVDNGKLSQARLFQAAVSVVAFPDNLNVYGGNPQVAEKGDSGGPVFRKGDRRELAAVVSGHTEFNRRNVATDLYIPLTGKNREWIVKQMPKEGAAKPASQSQCP
jgi:secreted trypsin-like serine protease